MTHWAKRLKTAIRILVNKEYGEYIEALKVYDMATALLEQLNDRIRDTQYDYHITPADGLIIEQQRTAEQQFKTARKAAGIES